MQLKQLDQSMTNHRLEKNLVFNIRPINTSGYNKHIKIQNWTYYVEDLNEIVSIDRITINSSVAVLGNLKREIV